MPAASIEAGAHRVGPAVGRFVKTNLFELQVIAVSVAIDGVEALEGDASQVLGGRDAVENNRLVLGQGVQELDNRGIAGKSEKGMIPGVDQVGLGEILDLREIHHHAVGGVAGLVDDAAGKGDFDDVAMPVQMEQELLLEAQNLGLGAQFGGKYFAHDIRVIRLPRHGASCPVGMGVSCSADRNIKAKINRDGIWIEKLESNPGKYIPEHLRQAGEGEAVKVNLNQPMSEILAQLSQYPVSTRLSLSGTIIVARDIAHAKLKELIDNGEALPQYVKDHPIYYAGPAKTPDGYASGSLGPTTAGRMDSYVDLLQSHGASKIMLAKGNRSQQVTDACHKHGGFYLGSIGGPAAVLAQQSIKSLECVAYPELGMEAIWKIEVEDFPAFILVDDKGNDFFQQIQTSQCARCVK